MGDLLVAVDGSKYSDQIVDYACELANRLEKKLELIYVSKDPDFVNEYIEYGGRTPTRNAQYTVSIAESVTSKFGKRIEEKGIEYEIVLDSGNAADKIVSTASERKCDLIIIGLKGLHGVERIRSVGSVSRRVIEYSPCPVAVITIE